MLCSAYQALQGQDSLKVVVVFDNDKASKYWIAEDALDEHIGGLIDSLHHAHHLEVRLDSLVQKKSSTNAYLRKGPQYGDIYITPNQTAIALSLIHI